MRATHSAPGKILTCLRSLADPLHVAAACTGTTSSGCKGGYLYPVYRESDADLLKNLLPLQKSYGLKIDFAAPQAGPGAIVPGINTEGLLGGTFAPEDGSISPLLVANAYYRRAMSLGVEFRFKEKISRMLVDERPRASGSTPTAAGTTAPVVVDAAGPLSAAIVRNGRRPISRWSRTATRPPSPSRCKPFFQCMVVDIRPAPGSKNFYFYQNRHGQVVFCITPDPPIVGHRQARDLGLPAPDLHAGSSHLLPRLEEPAGAPNLARACTP
ncbi:MAG: FAD-dependent oxidoreductase [Desulfobacterales bacterium]|nr:FAD-dependent oxidoreductase [Desulfobacterales bacterium]